MKIELWIQDEKLTGEVKGFQFCCSGVGDSVSALYTEGGYRLIDTVDIDILPHVVIASREAADNISKRKEIALQEYNDRILELDSAAAKLNAVIEVK